MNEVVLDPSDMKDIGGGSGIDLSELINSDELIGHIKNINSKIGEDEGLTNSYLQFRDEITNAQIAELDTSAITSGSQFDTVNFAGTDDGFIELSDDDFFRFNDDDIIEGAFIDNSIDIESQTFEDDGIIFIKDEYCEDSEIEFAIWIN